MYVCVCNDSESIGEELQGAYRRALGGFARAVVTLDGLLSSPQYTQVPTSFDTPIKYSCQAEGQAGHSTRCHVHTKARITVSCLFLSVLSFPPSSSSSSPLVCLCDAAGVEFAAEPEQGAVGTRRRMGTTPPLPCSHTIINSRNTRDAFTDTPWSCCSQTLSGPPSMVDWQPLPSPRPTFSSHISLSSPPPS
jgi:hypothetical protein